MVQPTSALTHYVLIRNDLPIGFAMAQAVHAAGESVETRAPPQTNAVVLSVPDEATLLSLADRLEDAGVPHSLIREPDPPWLGQATAIGIEPVADRKHVKRILARLSLFGTDK